MHSKPSIEALSARLPASSVAEILSLQCDGYALYREWSNGVEMRKPYRGGDALYMLKLLAIVLAPVVTLPYFGHAVFFGYRHRVLVSKDAEECQVHFV